MSDPEIIDVHMHGRPGLTAAYLIRGRDATGLIDCGPASSLRRTLSALERLGVTALDWIVLTHIHLDHAGAAGAIAARFPAARIAVHPRGKRHLIDPARLWEGVRGVYGEATDRIWGRPDPIAEERVHAVEDGAAVDLGDRMLTAIATPGHARHHHAWLDSRTGDAFVGDAIGMQVGDSELWRATTPPPDFDLDLAQDSIARIRAAGPRRVWLGHFGAATAGGDPYAASAALDDGARTLEAWVGAVRSVRADGGKGALGPALSAWLRAREQAEGWPVDASATTRARPATRRSTRPAWPAGWTVHDCRTIVASQPLRL